MTALTPFKLRLRIGLIGWFLWALWQLPLPLEASWGRLLVLFAPLIVVPLTLDLLEKLDLQFPPNFFNTINKSQLVAALTLTVSYLLPQSNLAGLLSLPWLFFTAWIAWGGLYALFFNKGKWNWGKWSISTGMIYLLVGGAWATFDRFGLRPLNFDSEIIFLTVAHFHYAGFVLPIVAGLAANEVKKWCGKTAVAGITIGVLLVAVGIVSTHLGGSPKMETFAAWWLAIAAILLAGIHFRLAMQPGRKASVSIFWVFAGAALLWGMALAGLYGMRHIWAMPGLDIAWMRALHGSANVFGFSLLAVLGWRIQVLKS